MNSTTRRGTNEATEPRGAPGPYAAALARFARDHADGWGALPPFRDGRLAAAAARADARAASGAAVLPAPADLLRALALTPPEAARALVLGQDPYPTPGDAHGLAFSVAPGRRVPASLRNVLAELSDDLGVPRPAGGSLLAWAGAGVLLLNTALTVEAGKAGAHRRFGWGALADAVVAHLAARAAPCAFLLWGADARARAPGIDPARHVVIESAHPSPLAMGKGFKGSRPFSRANEGLVARGGAPIKWQLE